MQQERLLSINKVSCLSMVVMDKFGRETPTETTRSRLRDNHVGGRMSPFFYVYIDLIEFLFKAVL